MYDASSQQITLTLGKQVLGLSGCMQNVKTISATVGTFTFEHGQLWITD